ncbi:uncharacterized protein LOC8259943 isoform X2 [Ricinus communis]|uniref:uncharacterized protein LOC8259943 isoform X2 n=1 Tax=Ricinus communis TaxID=3988 RepID=UPI00077238AD|nr:uncharacterized protein LOC8259943 isoform X2 [Ricinus communis]XP_048228933.1 uncharacterized protein LOC8259943 isoform X2 [Ricinus communis]|eukprot:XP_015571181.1 uncharacterized protein LOC8259943 isoform X2 [Ricinus communis]
MTFNVCMLFYALNRESDPLKRSKILTLARKLPKRTPLLLLLLPRMRRRVDMVPSLSVWQQVNIEKEALLRFIVMGRKSLPDPSKKSQPYWGFVDLVTTNIDDVKNALGGEEYDTSTRGHRHKYPARALGEGIYRILRHNPFKRMHTHLVYKLEFPPEDEGNEPQQSLNIDRQASFVIQIKNPEQHQSSRFRGLQNKRKAVFPAHLEGQFGQKGYCPADPPDFLNYEGCEFLLISASDDIEDELGLELKTECEAAADSPCSDLVETFGESVATSALFRGSWA